MAMREVRRAEGLLSRPRKQAARGECLARARRHDDDGEARLVASEAREAEVSLRDRHADERLSALVPPDGWVGLLRQRERERELWAKKWTGLGKPTRRPVAAVRREAA